MLIPDYKLYNFEIRVGESDEIGNNEICHKQLDFMVPLQKNITCSRAIYGNWVSINKTDTELDIESLTLIEVRAFEYTCKYNLNKISVTEYF